MNEETKISFSEGITEYITNALSIWPALQLALSHLQQAVNPPQGSPIKHYNFASMDRKQFIQTITKDLHDYIQQHDVKEEHILDYLRDVLQILNTQEENENTMKHMSREMVKLIQQLPDGNVTRLLKFRQVYKQLKSQSINHIVQNQVHECENDESCEECEGSEEDSSNGQMSDEDDQWQQEDNNMQDEAPNLVQSSQKEKELEEDGWVIVKPKKKSNK